MVHLTDILHLAGVFFFYPWALKLFLFVKICWEMHKLRLLRNMGQQLSHLCFSFHLCCCHIQTLRLFLCQTEFVAVFHWLPAVACHVLLLHFLPNTVSPSVLLEFADITENSSIFFRCIRKPACLQSNNKHEFRYMSCFLWSAAQMSYKCYNSYLHELYVLCLAQQKTQKLWRDWACSSLHPAAGCPWCSQECIAWTHTLRERTFVVF